MSYGNASTLKKNLKFPVCCTPSRNCRLMLAPGGKGVPSVMVPALSELFHPPPRACAGGCSNVVPSTVTVQGGDPAPDAVQVPASVTPVTVTLVDVKALTSATPGVPLISVLISTIRNRKRVTGAPVLFTKRRLTESVPLAPFVTGVRSRTRFGGAGPPKFESRSSPIIVLLRSSGLARFCGPGAPRRRP